MSASGNTARDEILQTYVRQILEVGQPQAIVLFGSSARGDAAGDSDFDLLVIEDTLLPPTQRALRYRLALHPRRLPVDLLVRTPAEVRDAVSEGRSFMSDVMRAGRVLHGYL
jgi:predicted nucleotidyltransferase